MKIIKLIIPKLQLCFLGEVIGGLVQGVGSIFGANTSAEASSRNTKRQIAWERERATNAHQWEVEDLKKAGINPILTAGGSGATTGGISPQMPDTSGYGKAGEAVSIAIQNAIMNKQRQQEINSSVALQQAQAQEAKANAEMINKRMDEIDANIANLGASSLLMGQQTHSAEAQQRHTEQLIDKVKIEMSKLEQETENLKAERDLLKEEIKTAPTKRKAIKIKNEIDKVEKQIKEKENKWYNTNQVFDKVEKSARAISMLGGTFMLGPVLKKGTGLLKAGALTNHTKEMKYLSERKKALYDAYGILMNHKK